MVRKKIDIDLGDVTRDGIIPLVCTCLSISPPREYRFYGHFVASCGFRSISCLLSIFRIHSKRGVDKENAGALFVVSGTNFTLIGDLICDGVNKYFMILGIVEEHFLPNKNPQCIQQLQSAWN